MLLQSPLAIFNMQPLTSSISTDKNSDIKQTTLYDAIYE